MKAGSRSRLWRQWCMGGGAALGAAFVVACGDSIAGPAPVASVSVSIAAPTVPVGTKTQAVASVKDGGGNVLDGRTVAWTSSNTEVASVSPTGEVTALRAGTAEIKATSEGKEGSATLTVIPPPVATVVVTLASPTITPGNTTTASAVLSDANGNLLTGRAVAWSSSDVAVATVSDQGVVTAIKAGNASIIAASEGKSGSAPLTVMPAAIHTITVTIANPALHVGETTQASAVAKDASGNTLTGRPIVWTTSNSEVATVNAQGVVTAVKVGTATITATSEGKSGSANVAVGAVPIHSITVVIADPSMQVGGTRQASAVAKDAHGNELTGRPIVWSTDNAEVATVSPQGLVTGVKAGTATITATSENRSGSATITVSASASVSGVVVTLPQPGLSMGFSIQASASVKDASGNPISGQAVTWSSSNTAVATVSQSGVVTGVGRGDANIIATSDGKSGSATIGVVVIRPQSLSSSSSHTCAIAVDGEAYCWGNNATGQLGNGSTSPSAAPVRVEGGIKFTAISAGHVITYALAENGQMYCWGSCPSPGTQSLVPRPWPTARPAEVVEAGGGSSPACVLRVGETAWCWGTNLHGQLGAGVRGVALVNYPEGPVAGNHAFADISSGSDNHVCAITTAGAGYCWGGGRSGERGALGAGAGAAKESLVPQAVSGNHVFKDLAVGWEHSCAVTTGGQAYCWGDNSSGQLGVTTPGCAFGGDHCSAIPVAVTGGHVFESISAQSHKACGLKASGEIFCWGYPFGVTPSPFGAGVSYRAVSTGFDFVCATSTDGDIYCRRDFGVISKLAAPVKFRVP